MRQSELEEEVRLLEKARAELRTGALAQSLVTLEASKAKFSFPELYQEREALTIELMYFANSSTRNAQNRRARGKRQKPPCGRGVASRNTTRGSDVSAEQMVEASLVLAGKAGHLVLRPVLGQGWQTTMTDIAPLRDLLEGVVAVQLAAAGPGLVPESVRGFGAVLDAEAGVLSLIVLDEQSVAFREAAARAGTFAVNLTDPLTFRGLQLKGPLVAIEEASNDARAAANTYFGAFGATLARVGFQAAQLRGFFHGHGGARWVRMRPEHVFNQTPGPGAGAPL